MLYFPDAPADEDLTATQRLVLAEFRALLERVRPTRTRPELTSVVSEVPSAHFILEVAHDQRDDFTVGLSLFEDDELMAYWGRLAHDDFFLPQYDTPEAGVNDALGFIEQALTGRFEVRTTYRGDLVIRATTFWVGDDDTRQSLGTTGRLLFNPFRRKRRETIRLSFVD